MRFLIPGVTTADQARLQQKLESIYFLDKRCFSLSIFEVGLLLKMKTINFCYLFYELKLNTTGGTTNDRARLFIFIKFIKKNNNKKKHWQKMSKAIDENKLTFTIKILL